MKLVALAFAAIGLVYAQDPPAAPTGVSATGQASQIFLDWANNSPTPSGYNVWRAPTSGGVYVKINASLLTTSEYPDASAVVGTPYFYVIRAENTPVESPNSAEVTAVRTGTDVTPPNPPAITSLSRKTRDTTPSTSGTAEPGTTLLVYSGATQVGETTTASNGTWTVANPSSLGSDGIYSIIAKARDLGGNLSGASTAIQITLDTTPPQPPTNVRTTGYHNCVDVEWTASTSVDVAGYKVERKTSSGSWTLLNANLVLGTKYRDSTVSNGTTYQYRVSAVDDALDY
jgi:hypothetical protein